MSSIRNLLASGMIAVFCIAPLSAATTYEPTLEGIAIRDEAYRDHIVYIVFNDETSRAAKAPLKITSRSITFVDVKSKDLYSVLLSDVNMPATLHVNNDLIPQGLWMDEEIYKIRNVVIRQLSYEEMLVVRSELQADLLAAKQVYREALTGAKCGSKRGTAAELCAMNTTATANRRMQVIEAKAVARVKRDRQ